MICEDYLYIKLYSQTSTQTKGRQIADTHVRTSRVSLDSGDLGRRILGSWPVWAMASTCLTNQADKNCESSDLREAVGMRVTMGDKAFLYVTPTP